MVLLLDALFLCNEGDDRLLDGLAVAVDHGSDLAVDFIGLH